jgi:tetratricopeptide (TPR) repeat protein
MAGTSNIKTPWQTTIWIAIAVISILWWIIAAERSLQRAVLIVWLSLASFMVGALVGFLFSSYGEESSIGKIRDWLVGVITALTVAKAATFKNVLALFAAGPGSAEFAFALSAAVFYAGVGFFFMFFQRELILNVLLAQSRAERGKLEGSKEAGHVIQRLLARLPVSILAGVSDISEIADKKEAQQLREPLYSDDVENFMKQADEAAQNGSLDWDTVSKAAYIAYYRTYFENEDEKYRAAVQKALEWLTRALNMNPLHVDLTIKYADMLGANKEEDATIAVLERLNLRPEAPLFVKQWLGYYLLSRPDQLDEAIRLSEEYHRLFPRETDSYFNIAYAYALKYCEELRGKQQTSNLESENREKALAFLREALQDQPEMTPKIQTKWFEGGKGPDCMLKDKEFRAMIKLPEKTPAEDSSGIPVGHAIKLKEPGNQA